LWDVREDDVGGPSRRPEQDYRAMGNTLHEQDIHACAMQQAELPRTRQLDCADLDNIAEEIESTARSEKRKLTNRVIALLSHLLKWRFQPAFRGNSWRLTIKEQRVSLRQHLRDNSSLNSYLDQAILDAFARARINAHRETGLAGETFPDACPFSFDQAIDDDFWPDD
jgi:hypothetical protein